MYSPKISEDLIPELYQIGKQRKRPMTKLVDEVLRNWLVSIKQGDRADEDCECTGKCIQEQKTIKKIN
jgi:hypothetical protein